MSSRVWRKSLRRDYSPLLPFKLVPWSHCLHLFIPSLHHLSKHHSLVRKLPTDSSKSPNHIRWRIGRWRNRDSNREKERGKNFQKNLAEIQKQKSFPHFTADNRQGEERGRPVPTAQSFKTNETLCVSRVDRGPAQTRHVHHSLHGLSASGTSTVWNRTGSSLLYFLTPSCLGSTGDQMLLILSLLLRPHSGRK